MLDFGAGEFVVVGVVALIAIGPKELPGVLRTIGRSVGKMRRMAGDFQNQFNDAMREMELEEARKKVEEMGQSVSESMQSATHVDLTIPTTVRTTDLTETAIPDTSHKSTVDGVSNSILETLPVDHAPSAEVLVSQAQTEAHAHIDQKSTDTAPVVSDTVFIGVKPDLGVSKDGQTHQVRSHQIQSYQVQSHQIQAHDDLPQNDHKKGPHI
jgi:sec-independent protein translocase protein TatB